MPYLSINRETIRDLSYCLVTQLQFDWKLLLFLGMGETCRGEFHACMIRDQVDQYQIPRRNFRRKRYHCKK